MPSSARLARVRVGRPRRGPSRVRASSIRAASPTVHGTVSSEVLRGRYSRCTSVALRMPLPAAVSSARAPRRSCRNSWGDRRGHIRSSASVTSGTRRSRWRQVLLLLGRRRVVRPVDAAPSEPGPVLVRQRPQDLGLHEAPAGIVRPGPAPGHAHDVLGRPGPQAQHAGAEWDLDVPAQRALRGCVRPWPAPSPCARRPSAWPRRGRRRRGRAPRAPAPPRSTG